MGQREHAMVAFAGESSRDLLAAMEANMVDHMAHLPSLLEGATVVAGPDLVLVDAGVPTDTFNVICGAHLDPTTAGIRIDTALAHFRTRAAPFTWWVGPTSRPSDLPARLVARGLVEAEVELGMALDLARLSPAAAPPPANLEVRRVTTSAELEAYARVVAALWDPPDQGVIDVYSRGAAATLVPGSPARYYIGYLDGEPVATSECYLGHGVVGVYAVVTLPHVRRRGIGSALTVAPLLDGRAGGYQTATLQASAAGQGMYARLGFVTCGIFHEYKPGHAYDRRVT